MRFSVGSSASSAAIALAASVSMGVGVDVAPVVAGAGDAPVAGVMWAAVFAEAVADGDALGSAFAFGAVLVDCGVEVDLVDLVDDFLDLDWV